MTPLDHGAPSSTGVTPADVLMALALLVILGAIGFGLWRFVQRMRS